MSKEISETVTSTINNTVFKLCDLNDCFSAKISEHDVELDVLTIKNIISSDLSIKLKNDEVTDAKIIESIPIFMNEWPGWSRLDEFVRGEIDYETWFEKFRQYLIYKTSTLLKNNRCRKRNKNTLIQTPGVTPNIKPDPNYTLVLSGPPRIVSNLVFSALENHIIIKQHTDTNWTFLEPTQFLNWPYVSVTFTLPEISITREMNIEYHRYISLCGDMTANPTADYIDSITETSSEHEVYTYNFLRTYFRHLLGLLHKMKEIPKDRVMEISTVLYQFLNDISAVNIHGKTIATNCKVSYNIGKFKYIRNKKISAPTAVNFYEILIPRVQFCLNKFSVAQQNCGSTVNFTQIDNLKALMKVRPDTKELKTFKEVIKNFCIVYKCLFCNESFAGLCAKSEVMNHFENNHKNEQSVLCFKCRLQFEIKDLAGNRWIHNCNFN